MKRRYYYYILVIILLISTVLVVYFSNRSTKEKFKVKSDSDFYILASKSINSYQLENDKIKALGQSVVQLPDSVQVNFHKGEFSPKHLLISGGDNFSKTSDERLISIDFQKGIIEQKKTNHYASEGSGYSENYFYTANDGKLYQFDNLGREKNTYQLEEKTTAGVQFLGQDGKLYLIASQQSKVNTSIYEPYLFIFEEEQLKLLDKIPLDDSAEETYVVSSLAVIGNYIYIPVAEIRESSGSGREASQQLMIYNLKTKVKEYIKLPESYPQLTYLSKMKDHLVFVHEPHMLKKSGISIFNRESKKSEFVNISEILGNENLNESQVLSVNTDKNNRLFILTKAGLIVWDMLENKLVDLDKNIDGTAFYVWVKN